MSFGPITHAGSNWRKLCRRYNLDPLEATADQVEQAIRDTVVVERLPPIRMVSIDLTATLEPDQRQAIADALSPDARPEDVDASDL